MPGGHEVAGNGLSRCPDQPTVFRRHAYAGSACYRVPWRGELEAVGPLWDCFLAGHGLESRCGDAEVLGMVDTDQRRADDQLGGESCRTRDLSRRPQSVPRLE